MRSHKTRIRRLPGVATVLIGLLIAACSPTPSADTADPTTSQSPATSQSTTPAASDTTEPATASQVLADAVDSLVEAGTYTFEAKILLSLQDTPTEVELEGWVDDSDRELVMRIGDQSVTTRVIDGVATVERNGETFEVPLTEAGSAPSIVILKSIQGAEFQADGTITGELDASDVASSDYEITGSAAIEVIVASDGTLAGYTMIADDDSWSVEVKLTDVGEDPNR